MSIQEIKSKIEAILLVVGQEGISIDRLQKLLSVSKDEIRDAIRELISDFENRGIRIIEHKDTWQLTTAADQSQTIEDLVKSEYADALSKASLEVLAIIAYKGPLTRAEIEYIRGVNSSFSLRNLLLRGLIERIENPKDARSYIYQISVEFLKHLGMEKVENLPEWTEYQKAKIEIPKTNSNTEGNTKP